MADEGEDSGQITPGQDIGTFDPGSSGNRASIDTDPQNPEGPGVAPASPVGDDNYYARQQSDILAKHHEREEYYRNAMESHIKALERAAAQSDAEIAAQKKAQPQVANPLMQRQQQIGQQLQGGGQGNGVGGAIMGIIALGAIAATVFGRKKNPYIREALMGGVGAMMHNYAKARHGRVEELKQEWHQLNDINNQQNRERIQNERSVLADKRLDLQQQMDILKTYGQLYNDERLIGDADSRNVARVQKNLDDKEKAAHRADQLSHQGNPRPKTAEWAAYRMHVIEQSHGTLDPQKDSDLSESKQRYPYGDFLKEYYTEKEQAKKAAKESVSKDQGAIGKPNDRLGLGLGQ